MAEQIESAAEQPTDNEAAVTRWLKEIEFSDKHERDWRERAGKIVKRYRDDDRKDQGENQKSRFNILYANTEVLKGVMYQKTPVPDARRRFLDKDPIGRQAAQILQRALSYSLDAYDFDAVMRQCVEDVLLPGRGIARVKYSPTMGKVDVPQQDGSVVQEDRVVYHEVSCDYIEWKWFRMSPAPSWRKVRWVAFGELMTRDELVKAFGDKGKLCSLDWAPDDKEQDELFKRALVWAIWDKRSHTLVYVSKGMPSQPLNVVQDPLNLEGFFPCPKPIVSITTNGNMVPVPEFVQYQDQAIELDNVTQRIDALVDALRRRGVYDAAYAEIQKLATAGDNEFIPVENFTNLAEKGGISSALYEQPIDTIAKVLAGLYTQRDQIKQVIYEVTGIADIVRGATKATETLGAQEMKAKYAGVRTNPRTDLIAKFARDILRLKAEIIAEKFDDTTLKLMTGESLWFVDQQVPGPDGRVTTQKVDATTQIMELLRNEKLRGFRIDIETDSTVQPDAGEEQKNRIEFLSAMTQFVAQIMPAVQSGAVPIEVAREFVSFGARAFKVSPQLEDALDALGGDSQQQGQDKAQQQQVQQQVQAAEVAVKQAEAREAAAKAEEAEAAAHKAHAEAMEVALRIQATYGVQLGPDGMPVGGMPRVPIQAPQGMPMGEGAIPNAASAPMQGAMQ